MAHGGKELFWICYCVVGAFIATGRQRLIAFFVLLSLSLRWVVGETDTFRVNGVGQAKLTHNNSSHLMKVKNLDIAIVFLAQSILRILVPGLPARFGSPLSALEAWKRKRTQHATRGKIAWHTHHLIR